MKDTQKIQDKILAAALLNVAFDGWSWEMICAAAQDAGYNENIARAVFPEKLIGVLDHFSGWADRQMLACLSDIDPSEMRVRDRIRTALMMRYEVLSEHKEAVQQSLQYWLWPTRKPRAAEITWRCADVIWLWAGDDAKDYNRYTKRGLLSAVIASTTLAWLNDPSEDMSKTQAFLDRRIENVMQFGKAIQTVKSKLS